MRIVMHSGKERTFDERKLEASIEKMKRSSKEINRLPDEHFNLTAILLEEHYKRFGHIPDIEGIQNIVVYEIAQALCCN